METATLSQKRRRQSDDCSAMSHETAAKKPHIDPSSIQQLFQSFQKELDYRHDKYERIVKCSRDITIQSKRAIFLLHRGLNEKTRATTLEEAAGKFAGIKELFKKIARELLHEDCYQFVRAYAPGLQEFVEAFSFWHFLKHKSLVSFENICKELVFENDCQKTASEEIQKEVPNPPGERNQAFIPPERSAPPQAPGTPCQTIQVPIPPAEYILGISDLTGELMRLAINSVGQGNLKTPAEICEMLRNIHDEFVMFGNQQRGLSKKLEVLKNSLKKVENTCYNIHIRGSEVPENMLANLIASSNDSSADGGQ